MKFRIIGTVIVLGVLAALFVLSSGQEQNTNQPVAPVNDTGLQPLKIN